MSLLGVDVGTTGCKAAAYRDDGHQLALHYEEYSIQRPKPGWAQLDGEEVWEKVKLTIKNVAAKCDQDPISSLSVSSLGEAVVPVAFDRKILGPSILNFDQRGAEFIPPLRKELSEDYLYSINGNTLGNQYGLTKLMWIKQHHPALYQQADKFLFWSSFVAFMLGAEPTVDYSLANRMLLFDLGQCDWSGDLLQIANLNREKLPNPAPSGTIIGKVSANIADDLNLPSGVTITTGAHDQTAGALGCGVIESGSAVFGMGTFICITPVFKKRLKSSAMIELGLNIEHHAAPGRYVSFIYNQGGSIVKWFRDTFTGQGDKITTADGDKIYSLLFNEMPFEPSSVVVLPHFTVTGPPHFISNSSGVIVGLNLETSRGDILKGILEGVTFSLKEVVDSLSKPGIEIHEYRPTGGGSKSEAWIQTSADILGTPFKLPQVKEAGTLGAAIIAGVGSGIFATFEEGVEATVRIERSFEPDANNHLRYLENYQVYKEMWPLLEDFLGNKAGIK